MKVLKNILSLVIGSILIMSCSDDSKETDIVFSSKEAAESIDEFSSTMHTDIVDMVNSTGTSALTDLVDLISGDNLFGGRIDPNAARQERIIQRVKAIKRVFVPVGTLTQLREDERFDFEANKGIYNYDFSTNKFVKSQEVADHIAINFPSEGSTTNNASLRLLSYADVLIEKEISEYLPSILVADLTVDATVVVSLDLEANWNSQGIPEMAEVTLFVIPFDYILKFSNSATISSALSFSVNKDNESILGTNVNVTFKSEAKEEVSKANGDVSYRAYSLRGDIDAVGLEGAEGDENANINDYFNLALYQGENKIGDVILEESTNGEDLDAFIVYSDGTKELLETVMQPIFDELELFFESLEGNG